MVINNIISIRASGQTQGGRDQGGPLKDKNAAIQLLDCKGPDLPQSVYSVGTWGCYTGICLPTGVMLTGQELRLCIPLPMHPSQNLTGVLHIVSSQQIFKSHNKTLHINLSGKHWEREQVWGDEKRKGTNLTSWWAVPTPDLSLETEESEFQHST